MYKILDKADDCVRCANLGPENSNVFEARRTEQISHLDEIIFRNCDDVSQLTDMADNMWIGHDTWCFVIFQNIARLVDFECFQTLGTGTFGRVLLVQHRVSKEYMALKILEKLKVKIVRSI